MTGDFWIDNAISATGIAFVILLVFLVFRRDVTPITRENAAARLTLDEPDFIPCDWLEDRNGAAVLAADRGGEFALVRRVGDSMLVRRFLNSAVKASHVKGALFIDFPDVSLRRVCIEADNVADWAARLRAPDEKEG